MGSSCSGRPSACAWKVRRNAVASHPGTAFFAVLVAHECRACARRCVAGGKDSPNQAILQFEKLQNNNDISLAATAACLFAHKRCRLVDQEAVDMLGLSVDSKQS